ncbi:hypothetical protein ACQKD6_02675 [Bacillus cereus]|uniref:hypothetical protein n=1 Tax=Bacillus cereus TaxID=1396 RepID=UPI00330A4728|nr:hypothetical protein [Bacillus anthracis]
MTKNIFTKWVAEELAKRGHVYDTEPNKKLPRYKVFIFKETLQFQRDLIEITQKR